MSLMSRDAKQILKDALVLPPEARAALADSLLDSLDTAIDEHAELAWQQEIEQRVKEIDSGRVRMIPWREVRSRLLAAENNAR